ncbi:MAG: hypothetical protein KatS3mg082_1041 [Nitrospiraceae bacterium]|nr:MAG: hypothetical protein KatS3mg082_1041 [Nitrospiraceae bacterium]
MKPVRPLFIPSPTQEAPEDGRLILRDGTTAAVRIARRKTRPRSSPLWTACRLRRSGTGFSPKRLRRMMSSPTSATPHIPHPS